MSITYDEIKMKYIKMKYINTKQPYINKNNDNISTTDESSMYACLYVYDLYGVDFEDGIFIDSYLL